MIDYQGQNNKMVETTGGSILTLNPSYGVGTVMPFSDKKNIFKKLNDVMQQVSWISKDGKVDFPGTKYNYTSEQQFIAEVRPLFVQLGLVIYPSKVTRWEISKTEKGSNLTTVQIMYIIGDTDSGETIEVEVVSQGSDSTDKGVYKAMTGAFKYAMRQALMIGTGEDPEATDDDGNDTSKPVTRKNTAPKSTPQESVERRTPEEYQAVVKKLLGEIDLEGAEVVFKKNGINIKKLPTNTKVLRYLYDFGREIKSGKDVLEAAEDLDKRLNEKNDRTV